MTASEPRLPGRLPRALRVAWRALVWSFWVVYFGFVVLVLALRYGVLPHIERYRIDIERLASRQLGQSVSIGRIEASWEGINPDLTLLDVRFAEHDGRQAFAIARVEAIFSWWSVPSAQLKLRLLRIDQPTLNLRRDAEGRIFIAGIPVTHEPGGSGASDWILGQRRLRIHGATLIWDDALRQAPTLVLEDVNFALDNNGERHAFGLTARPPRALAAKIDVRGDLKGSDIEHIGSWSGTAYAEVDYADLAIWRQWIDYPVALPHGFGAVRAWFGVKRGGAQELTADVSLEDVRLRLARELPALEVDKLAGRISARFSEHGIDVRGQQVELATQRIAPSKSGAGGAREARHEDIHIAPTDFQVRWQPSTDGRSVEGSASASRLDLAALARLAAHLPFDARSRQLLSDYAPRGLIDGLQASWKGDADTLQSYSLKGRFAELALSAKGYFPGFSGLSGTLDADQRGGSATLQSTKPVVDLPTVFSESTIALDTLSAEATWRIKDGVIDVELSRVEFSGADAAGSAQGSYRNTGAGPGSVDLTATLTRGEARAVWRYMPLVVGPGARSWLRDALLGGAASDARLTLKGDLANFPFVDKTQGLFLVTAKASDVVLDYGRGWPRIEGIDGNLRFEGKGMVVDAQRGSILGAQLSNTRAEIADFDAPMPILTVKGKADGPTSEFLRFIEQSPVGERIDHFTQGMRAQGNGHLDLALVIPLDEDRLADSKIDGVYRLTNNEVVVDTALPPLKQVNGALQFSGNDLRIPEINATLLGGPLTIRGGSQKDGRVLINANGSISMAQLRAQSALPLLASLTGATTYQGKVQVNKRNADLVIESALVGVESSLPEPFGKSAGEALALRIEKKLLPAPAGENGDPAARAVRDQISASLGDAVSIELVRRKRGDAFENERGAIAVGRPLQLPASGVSLGVSAKRLDLDYWQRMLRPPGAAAGSEVGSPSPFDALSITTPELVFLGRHYNDVELNAVQKSAQWLIKLSSQQASGDLQWEEAGSGKLTARLGKLTIDPSTAANAPEVSEVTRELPALDIIADDFALGTRRFGRLEVLAHNERRTWRLDTIRVVNADGTMTGNGRWQLGGGRNRTELDFRIESDDVGKLLDRLGYPGTVRAGSVRFAGKIGWDGPPPSLDYATLSGDMTLDAAKGQFLKVDPGAGKLLGLISLQGLPRRITLDFRDVFSEGFAFDSMSSKIAVHNGLMSTERLQIDGPSARIVMRGEVDLKRETQRLNVNVQPELGGTAALGVALVNPVAGVATWLAHKILQNPLNQMFGFDYLITGKWDDPKVEKLSRSASPEFPRLPSIAQ